MGNVKLLSPPANYAVVHLPGRAFPGVVFQGDSLHALIADIREVAGETDPEERDFALKDIIERLETVQQHYEAVLGKEGIPRPY
ncbi:MAG: hypothetical protein J0H88_14145 [Sphingomonadales bacterium]|nr:hypothetical protein [Sphingomonadales bacterium]